MILKKKNVLIVSILGLMFLTGVSTSVKADEIQILNGRDRYETSLMVLDKIKSSDTIVLVDGKDEEKIINACNLASKYSAPVALVNSNKDEKVLEKIEDLNVKKTILIGDVNIENKINTSEIEKINKNGKELNKEVTEQLKNESDKAVVTENLADALSATTYSTKNKAPIYLVDKQIDDKTVEEINNEQKNEVLIVGGTVESDADIKLNNSKRIEGRDRYETSRKVANEVGVTKNLYADGKNYVDAISASALLNLDDSAGVVLVKNESDIDKNVDNLVIGGSLFDKVIKQVPVTIKEERVGDKIAKDAANYLGGRYVWGGTRLGVGVDCSGFTSSLYKKWGYSIPRSSYSQRFAGKSVSLNNAKPGDIVCFSGHVGMYVGDGYMIHASSPRAGIIKTKVNYGGKKVLDIRRIVE